jgi:subtilisin family serine protease
VHRPSTTFWSTLFIVTIAAVGFHAAGCGLEVLEVPATAVGGGGGAAGGGGDGGLGGQLEPSRGDPADFPTVCLETCPQACAELETCGGASSSLYPVDHEQCLARCGLAEDGPVWDDVSGNFKCCASQSGCDKVRHCGGWLDHPAAVGSCEQLCTCFFSGAVTSLIRGRRPPAGYSFAPNVLYVALHSSSNDLRAIPGVAAVGRGSYAQVTLGPQADAHTLAALRQAGRLLPTFTDSAGRISAATGRIVVVTDGVPARQRAAEIAANEGLSAPRRLAYGKGLWVIDSPDSWQALDLVEQLRAVGLRAELDMLRLHQQRYTPNDPLFGDQWHLLNLGQGVSTVSVDGRVSEAWDITLGDSQVIIAINDDGVDLNHLDFDGKLEPELNYPPDWQTLMAEGNFAGHGTSVAGVAAALGDDLLGGSGVCPGCQLLPHRIGETTLLGFQVTDTEVADGFVNMVDAGAWVINNSWGLPLGEATYVNTSFPLPALPTVIAAAFDYAETNGRGGAGTVILYAAGNHNQELDYYATYPSILAVAAVGDLGLKSYYSAFGPEVAIAAPSNGALTGITTSEVGGGHTNSFGGTSSACPFASGVVGLMLSANPSLTAGEVRGLLTASATPIDQVFGQYQSGHSVFYGAGLVNAYVAVQMATGNCTDPALCPAPSDDCATNCGTQTQCDDCRTHADCATDHVCQALPSLGKMVCVAAVGGGPCPTGTNEVNGYCLPTLETCGLCGTTEECNGRDDNCDGVVDEGVCSGAPRCFIDGLGCGDEKECAAIICVDACTGDDDCAEDYFCRVLKDQYGTYGAAKGCVVSQASQCDLGCSVLVSSLDDEAMAAFVECMGDGETSCNDASGCFGLLPISF